MYKILIWNVSDPDEISGEEPGKTEGGFVTCSQISSADARERRIAQCDLMVRLDLLSYDKN